MHADVIGRVAALAMGLAGAALVVPSTLHAGPRSFDVVIRNGELLDGSGQRSYRADIGIRDEYIAFIGNASRVQATIEIDAGGLFVTPGFINIHDHAQPEAVNISANTLTQGITTAIVNPDGFGSVDVEKQLREFATHGLAMSVGGYIGFNSVWAEVVGDVDRRPSRAQIQRMRELITRNLEWGVWGVSAGLDYKPAYSARTEEVIDVVEAARPWRTNFPNHERLTPENHWSSRAGIAETLQIANRAGLRPVITHIKVQGHEQGTAAGILAMLEANDIHGERAVGDVYPYIAGQARLEDLLVPASALAGGRAALMQRLKDPATRTHIAREIDSAIAARFGSPDGVFVIREQKDLAQLMAQSGNVSAGEAVLRVVEQGDSRSILRFGNEDDVRSFVVSSEIAIACDCGSATTIGHPRASGTFPRALGRYVREQHLLSWPEMVRKMTSLPAGIIGMTDRGYLAVGMRADVVVFDPKNIVDHATFAKPGERSQGVQEVLVNGRFAIRNGALTGEMHGQILQRLANMPSRPSMRASKRHVRLADVELRNADQASGRVTLEVSQVSQARRAQGVVRFDGPLGHLRATASDLGILQSYRGWSSLTGLMRNSAGREWPFLLTVDDRDPSAVSGSTTITLVLGRVTFKGGT